MRTAARSTSARQMVARRAPEQLEPQLLDAKCITQSAAASADLTARAGAATGGVGCA